MLSIKSKTYIIRAGMLFLTLVFFEVSLILFGIFFNRSVLYESLSDGAEDTSLEVNNHTLEIYKSPSSHEIVSFGDSFTNGGNVFKEDSYPFQLWENLDKKFTVRNVGICEQPTSDAYRSIELFIKGKIFSPKKSYTFLLLTGAANIFTDHLDMNRLNRDFRIKQKWKVIPDQDSEVFLNFLKKSKLISLTLFVGDLVKNKMISEFTRLSYSKESRRDLNLCLENEISSIRKECIKGAVPKENAHNLEEVIYAVSDFFTFRNIKPFKRTALLIEVLEVFPALSHHFEFTTRLMANLRRQSRIPFKSALSLLENSMKSSEDIFDDINKSRMENVFTGTDQWLEKVKLMDQFQEDGLDKIALFLKKYKNIKLIFLTYPISYTKLNESTRVMARKHNLDLIDLEKVFKEEIRSSKENLYITDWQHCTPKGYKLIADTIREHMALPMTQATK